MDKITIYTDGGCRGNGKTTNKGSWGAVLISGEHKKSIYGYTENTTNNIMELTGIIEVLKKIKKPENCWVDCHLDSQYVINGITSWIKGWKKKNWRNSSGKPVKNKDLWIELDNLVSQFPNIHFHHVKGHAGHKWNEYVDSLCNYAMDNKCNSK